VGFWRALCRALTLGTWLDGTETASVADLGEAGPLEDQQIASFRNKEPVLERQEAWLASLTHRATAGTALGSFSPSSVIHRSSASQRVMDTSPFREESGASLDGCHLGSFFAITEHLLLSLMVLQAAKGPTPGKGLLITPPSGRRGRGRGAREHEGQGRKLMLSAGTHSQDNSINPWTSPGPHSLIPL
jgi:hypothetical protein